MTEHNLNEFAVAVPAVLAKGAAIAGKAGKVAGVAKGIGKVASRASGDGGEEAGSTPKRVKIKPIQTEEELEFVCDYLLDEGYASTGIEAENIYSHMSEQWKQHIINS